uniref:transglutaminase domain-containing protein n=1 Tax=Gelidibacter sp. TaxID=2018083 RepID=UPI00404B7A55
MKQVFITFIIFFSFQNLQSQDYKYIDSTVSTYPKKFKSIKHFADKIDKDFNTDLEKIRATYYWISNNIIYDYKSYRNNENGYDKIEVKSEEYYQNSLLEMERKYAEKSLQRNLAVCEGYSQLLKFTLMELNIECDVITGYAKTSSNEIGSIRNGSNHAWNAVKINNEWKLIDATWSTGNEENNPKAVNFSDEYFFIEPNKLILNHFPDEEKWQLLQSPVTKESFFFKPIIFETYFNSGLIINEKQSGLIKVKKGDIIKLVFDKADMDKFYSYSFNQDKYSSNFLFEKINDKYVAEIEFPYEKNSVLMIFDNYYSIMEFKIILERK